MVLANEFPTRLLFMHDHSDLNPVEVVLLGDNLRASCRTHKLLVDSVEILDERLGLEVGLHNEMNILPCEFSTTVPEDNELVFG